MSEAVAPELSSQANPAADPHGEYGMRSLLSLAWPAVLSFLLGSAYRINDQFWIQGLGEAAQAAAGAVMFVVIMNFAVAFLAAGGTLSLIARATGAKDLGSAHSTARHALMLSTLIGGVATLAGFVGTPIIVGLLGLDGATAAFAEQYLGTLYLCSIWLFLSPVIDHIFIGRGDTRVPMLLQGTAIAINFALNPLFIYGTGVSEALPGVPLVGAFQAASEALGMEGMGMRGAAIATGISRFVSVLLGLALLRRRHGTSLLGNRRPQAAKLLQIAKISMPVSISIGVYAAVYWAMFALVLDPLDDDAVRAGLGIGFQVFEGIAFPCYLGVSVAGASLVGRALGAQDLAGADRAVKSSLLAARTLGLFFVVVFLGAGRLVASQFTEDPDVLHETLLYVSILAFSQYHVAVESLYEKVLLGSGSTRSIPWIAGTCNAVRIPLSWVLAIHLGWGAAGVWWAINVTTYAKAFLFWRQVRLGAWRK